MGNGIALKVMLLTPAFRNMDAALEEAARVGGASNLRTMLRITVPMMISPIALVSALQILRIFQSFETELLLGMPFRFYVYSTLIYDLVQLTEPPRYGQATVLASITLVVLVFIIPLQRWILQRRQYTTLGSGFRPGLIDLGRFRWLVFGAFVILHVLLTVVPVVALILGSLMIKSGYFMIDPVFTLDHWKFVLSDRAFIGALQTTLVIAFTTSIMSPVIFSIIAYILVRTRWPGRALLDSIIWVSAAIPGMLTGLGLLIVFLGTPGLTVLYGTIWTLIIVALLQGNTTGVNISKAAIVQLGFDLEEAARVSGAGWIKTYFRIWLPILMPTLIMLGTLHFVLAANATASIILLASRETTTLSILVLQYTMLGMREEAAAMNLVITVITVIAAASARYLGLPLGVRHDIKPH
jgi:iron(III) transport system permease protein